MNKLSGDQSPLLRIGTCSWKYPSWHPEVYSAPKGINYLAEYAVKYGTVEIDQWFWSLFGPNDIVLPQPHVVAEYAESVPGSFRFSIKAPNAITLTHYYKRYTGGRLVPNEQLLSNSLLDRFLESIEPLQSKLGPIMFQFEYLNRQKMRSLEVLLEKLDEFFDRAPSGFSYALEPRNPELFRREYFDLLVRRDLSHVFLQGYFMPNITSIFAKWNEFILNESVVRLHGYDRAEIEKRTKKQYDQVVASKDGELPGIIEMIQKMRSRGVSIYLNVNNHYEGSAPLTIEKILDLMPDRSDGGSI